jgi:uncharacterized phage-associated protein
MTQRPISVANEFIRQFGEQGTIDHLKLQKLVYFTQGWWLATKGEELLFERPQVWRFGPVFKSLYNIFSGARDEPITRPAGSNPFNDTPPPSLAAKAFESERAMVEWVWSEYGRLTGPELSDLTHAMGTPWRRIAERKKFRVELGTEIPEKEDWEYFANLARERGFKPAPLNG